MQTGGWKPNTQARPAKDTYKYDEVGRENRGEKKMSPYLKSSFWLDRAYRSGLAGRDPESGLRNMSGPTQALRYHCIWLVTL